MSKALLRMLSLRGSHANGSLSAQTMFEPLAACLRMKERRRHHGGESGRLKVCGRPVHIGKPAAWHQASLLRLLSKPRHRATCHHANASACEKRTSHYACLNLSMSVRTAVGPLRQESTLRLKGQPPFTQLQTSQGRAAGRLEARVHWLRLTC